MQFIKKNWFQLFKYIVYTALFFNVIFFFNKEMASSVHRFAGGLTLFEFIEAFTSTIDTAAWVVLLILFELETFIIDDEKLNGGLLWLFRGIRGFCYLFIVYSFWGYLNNYAWLMNFEAIDIQKVCELTGKSWMVEVDEFAAITTKNCNELSTDSSFLKHIGKDIYTDASYLKASTRLAIVDILNSLSWILIVIVLEIDVWWKG